VTADDEEHEKAYTYGRKVAASWTLRYQPVDLWIKRAGVEGYSLPSHRRITVPAWALGGMR